MLFVIEISNVFHLLVVVKLLAVFFVYKIKRFVKRIKRNVIYYINENNFSKCKE